MSTPGLPMVVPEPGLPERVTIYEVGPRDGLQNESALVPTAVKAEFVRRLARAGLPVAEYAPNRIKKSVVGAGHAGKAQIALMVEMLLPGARPATEHAADALAIAICHAHSGGADERIAAALLRAGAAR